MSKLPIQLTSRESFVALLVISLALTLIAGNAYSTVCYVDANSTNPTPPFTNWATAAIHIQDAVDVSSTSDEIVVSNGVYQIGARVVLGSTANRVAITKAVTVRSLNGPQVTVIQGYQVPGNPAAEGAVRCAYLASGATLFGFTLTGGSASFSGALEAFRSGGGIWCESSSAIISNCIISGNYAFANGGGVYGGTINSCTLSGNSVGSKGGGAYGSIIHNSALVENSALDGGGAYLCTLVGCTVVNNQARGGLGQGGGASGSTITNSIVYFNSAEIGGNIFGSTASHCCSIPLAIGGTGSFTNAPQFLNGGWTLAIDSPCINAGNNAYTYTTTDLAGQMRIVEGTVDLGAYEFQGTRLSVTSSSGGTTIRTPDQPYYARGSTVKVTALPAHGYGFIHWTGDAQGSANPLSVLMDTNKRLTAVFSSTVLTLVTQGAGSVAKVPDKSYYSVGEAVALSASAGRWHDFSRWSDGSVDNPRTVTIGESNIYAAIFTPTMPLETVVVSGVSRLAPVGMPVVRVNGQFAVAASQSARGVADVDLSTTFSGGWVMYTLNGTDPAVSGSLYTGPFTVRRPCVLRTVAYTADFTGLIAGDPVSVVILPTLTGLARGGGSVSIDPPDGAYYTNQIAKVTALPAPGWTFLQWLGDATGDNAVAFLNMSRSKSVEAVFGTALSTTAVGNGSIVGAPNSPWIPYGTKVMLTAVAARGSYHAIWANAAAGHTNNPLTFTVTNANPTVTALFASLGQARSNVLTVIPNGRGNVSVTPPGNLHPINSEVVLQAIAEDGQVFIGWSGSESGSETPLVVTLNSNKIVSAQFTSRPLLRGEGSPEVLKQEGFRVTLEGQMGTVYQLLGTVDSGQNAWQQLGVATNLWGTLQFLDPSAITNTHHLYRARAVSPR